MSGKRQRENPGGNTRDVNAASRAALALQLRLQKLSYEEIAQRVGYANKGVCHNAIQREMQKVIVANVEQLRREELAILDVLHSEAWAMAMDKSNKGRLFAFDRLLEISKERRKLMNIDIKPDEALTNQPYEKRIVLTHQEVTP